MVLLMRYCHSALYRSALVRSRYLHMVLGNSGCGVIITTLSTTKGTWFDICWAPICFYTVQVLGLLCLCRLAIQSLNMFLAIKVEGIRPCLFYLRCYWQTDRQTDSQTDKTTSFCNAVQIGTILRGCCGATLRSVILAAWRSLLRVSVCKTNRTRSLAFSSTPSWTCSHAYIISFHFIWYLTVWGVEPVVTDQTSWTCSLAYIIAFHFIPYSLECGAICDSSDILGLNAQVYIQHQLWAATPWGGSTNHQQQLPKSIDHSLLLFFSCRQLYTLVHFTMSACQLDFDRIKAGIGNDYDACLWRTMLCL